VAKVKRRDSDNAPQHRHLNIIDYFTGKPGGNSNARRFLPPQPKSTLDYQQRPLVTKRFAINLREYLSMELLAEASLCAQ
jgi:hypothetical protein